MTRIWRRGLIVTAFLAAPVSARAQEPAPAARPTPWALEVSTFYQGLDNNYGDWQGGSVRLSYSSPRISLS